MFNLHSDVSVDDELNDTMDYPNMRITYFDLFGSRKSGEETRKL